MVGRFCDIIASETIAVLGHRFHTEATMYGLQDSDAATVKDAQPHELTRAVSQYLGNARVRTGGGGGNGT